MHKYYNLAVAVSKLTPTKDGVGAALETFLALGKEQGKSPAYLKGLKEMQDVLGKSKNIPEFLAKLK